MLEDTWPCLKCLKLCICKAKCPLYLESCRSYHFLCIKPSYGSGETELMCAILSLFAAVINFGHPVGSVLAS